jgi:signal transduction histidine kinase
VGEDRRLGRWDASAGAEGGPHAVLALVEAMRPLDSDKAALLGAVSHQLRTPLTSVVGFVELLADGTVGPVTAEQLTVLQTVAHAAARLMDMVDALDPAGTDGAAGPDSGGTRPRR